MVKRGLGLVAKDSEEAPSTMFPRLPGARCALLLLLVCTPMTLTASPTPWVRFEVTPALGRQAAREAEELARFAQVALGIELDFSLASLPKVKHLTAALRADLRARPHEQAEVRALVDRLGSYLGEVYRREYGGTWGRARMAGGSRMALKSARGAGVWWPAGRIRRQLGGLAVPAAPAATHIERLLAQP